MRTHRVGKLTAGVVAAVAALTLMSLPASANTVDVDVTAGILTLRNPSNGTIDTIDLSTPGTPCATVVSTATTSGTNTISTTLRSNSAVEVNGQNFIIGLTTTLGGSWTGSGPYSMTSSSGSATASVIRSTGAGSCTALGGAGTCTVTASNIGWTGTLTAANPLTLVAGDTASSVNGGNSAFNTVVTGTATNCGTLTALNNGSVTIAGAALVVL